MTALLLRGLPYSLAALGKNAHGKNRMTRVKMDSPSFQGLRGALQDADARLGIEDDIPSSVPFVMCIKPPSKESVSLPNERTKLPRIHDPNGAVGLGTDLLWQSVVTGISIHEIQLGKRRIGS
jgi:hypothetical protein